MDTQQQPDEESDRKYDSDRNSEEGNGFNEAEGKENGGSENGIDTEEFGPDETGSDGIYEDDNYGNGDIRDLDPRELIEEGDTVTKEAISTLVPARDGNVEQGDTKPSVFETEILQRLFLAFCDKCVMYARELAREDLDSHKDAIFGLAEWVIQMLHYPNLYGPECPSLSPKGSAFWGKVLAQAYNILADVERTKGFLHSTLRHMEKVLKYEGILLRKSKATAILHETESKANPEEVICVDSYNIRIPALPMFPRRCKVLAQSVRTHLNTASTISLLDRHDDAYRQAQVAVSFVLMFQGNPEEYSVPQDEEEAASWDLLFALLLCQAYYAVATELEFLKDLKNAKANYEFAKNSLAPLYKNRKVREPIEFLDGGKMDPRDVYKDMEHLEKSCDCAIEELDKEIALREDGHQKRGESRQRGRVASRYAGRSTSRMGSTKKDRTKQYKSGKTKNKSAASTQPDQVWTELLEQYPSFEAFESKYTPPQCSDFFASDMENAVLEGIKARSGDPDADNLNKSQASGGSRASRNSPTKATGGSGGSRASRDSPTKATGGEAEVDSNWKAWDELLEDAKQRYNDICDLHPEGIPERKKMDFAKWLIRRVSSATEQFDTSTRNKLNKAKADAVGDERTSSHSSGRETVFDEVRESMSRKSNRR